MMAGVSLVGYSGSLIKDTISDALNLVTVHPTSIASDPIDQVDVTKALVGTVNHIFRLVSFDTIVKQACFSSCLLKYCKIYSPSQLFDHSTRFLTAPRPSSWLRRRS